MALTRGVFLACIFWVLASPPTATAAGKVSDATQDCIDCHRSVTPGIVADWERSRHSQITPAQALDPAKNPLERRMSATRVAAEMNDVVVGCAECHGVRGEKHKDTFDHGGMKIHVVVTPDDCAICHQVEVDQYGKNAMSHAHNNLKANPFFHTMLSTVNGDDALKAGKMVSTPGDPLTDDDSCFACHGSKVEFKGLKKRQTTLGEMAFPVLDGWPNQGVGRVNPDGSEGSCSACHARHAFSLEVARNPETCAQCHSGPDTPANKVYQTSKHGNIFYSIGKTFNMDAVPWTVGKDFTVPVCATCHISLIVNKQGKVLAERTHQMSDRLPYRIFGLPYAHAHPISPDTTHIINKAGLALPTELTGEPVTAALIDAKEVSARKQRLMNVCLPCHDSSLVDAHFTKFEHTIDTTNAQTLVATQIMQKIWDAGLADRTNPFDEAIERKWVQQWLVYANSTRFASAMMGAEFGVFTNGRWEATRGSRELADWLSEHLNSPKAKPAAH